MGQTLLEGEEALEEVLDWEAGLQALHARIALRFSSESRQRVLAYLQGAGVGGAQEWMAVGRIRWGRHARWGAAVAGGVPLGRGPGSGTTCKGTWWSIWAIPEGVLVVDETGFLKQGKKSVGVKRQYSGTAGKVENCQIGVFLAYGSRRGAAFLDRELYLPQEWAADGARRREAGVPEGVAFRTKAQLAQGMIERAIGSGVPFAWVTGDTVYGNDRKLRAVAGGAGAGVMCWR